jgi:tetratricopeptide (TPR) repeat protein
MKHAILILAASAFPAFAACPPAPDIAADEMRLFEQIRNAGNELAARPFSNGLWELWTMAPDEPAQALLDQGMSARSSFDFVSAIDALDRLVDYCPNYAEGYNQRAFVNFLRQDYAAALVDLDRAIELSPRHTGAITGKALTLSGLGREDEAQILLREAVELHPWLSERHLLKEPPGQEL